MYVSYGRAAKAWRCSHAVDLLFKYVASERKKHRQVLFRGVLERRRRGQGHPGAPRPQALRPPPAGPLHDGGREGAHGLLHYGQRQELFKLHHPRVSVAVCVCLAAACRAALLFFGRSGGGNAAVA